MIGGPIGWPIGGVLGDGAVYSQAVDRTATGTTSFVRSTGKLDNRSSTGTVTFQRAIAKTLTAFTTTGTVSVAYELFTNITLPSAALNLITRAITSITSVTQNRSLGGTITSAQSDPTNITSNRPLDDDITS